MHFKLDREVFLKTKNALFEAATSEVASFGPLLVDVLDNVKKELPTRFHELSLQNQFRFEPTDEGQRT